MFRKIFLPTLLTFALLFFFGCKKHHIKSHYTGKFQITEEYTSWAMWQPTHHETKVYTAEVSFYQKDKDGNYVLKFECSNGTSFFSCVDDDGHLTAYQCDPHYSFGGTFTDDDHLQFQSENSSPGGGCSSDAAGVRQ